MSVNCVRCVKSNRNGPDLLCDDCRLEKWRDDLKTVIAAAPLKAAGLIILDAAQAFLNKQNNYTPHGALLMRLATQDGKLTVCLARDGAAPMLATAHDALKKHLGAC